MLLKKHGKCVIFDCHENYVEKIKAKRWIPAYLRKSLSRAYRIAADRILPKLDYVIAATEDIAESLPRVRHAVIRNVPSTSQIAHNSDPGSRDPKLVLYTGGLTRYRGVEQVVRGLVEHCAVPWKLVVVGRENKEVTKRLSNYMRDSRIEVRGLVPFAEVVDLMGMASIGIVCNQPIFDYEKALPNKLFEYMAAGLPVICSNFPKWTALVEQVGAGVTCNPEDPASIGAACTFLLANPEKGREMGQQGRRAIERDLSWEREFVVLREVYGVCISERHV
jgi:glycosyltransferase involved in cell wall biosynthesis